jgi:hypothetical protein
MMDLDCFCIHLVTVLEIDFVSVDWARLPHLSATLIGAKATCCIFNLERQGNIIGGKRAKY